MSYGNFVYNDKGVILQLYLFSGIHKQKNTFGYHTSST